MLGSIRHKLFLMTALLGFLILALSAQASAVPSDLGVMGYQTWKAARIEEAKSAVDHVSHDEKPARGRKVRSGSDSRLAQAQINYDIAKELSVNDYFVLYLSQFKQRDAFVEAAKKLTSEELADLMMAYQKKINNPEPGTQDILPNVVRK